MFGLMRNLYHHLKKKGGPKECKLVFLGLDNAGKTTCVAALKGEPTEDATQTWGFNSETVDLSKFAVEVYDLGGGKSIRRMWENYYAEIHGIIFVVDASDESRLQEAKTTFQEVLSHTYARGKPLLVCANKQDLGKPMSANDLTDHFDLDSCKCNHLCVECTASGPEGSTPCQSFTEGVTWLVNTVSVQFNALQERVKKDTEIEREKQERKMRERRERVEKMKAQRLEESNKAEAPAKQDPSPKDSVQPPTEAAEETSPKIPSPESVYAVEESCGTEASQNEGMVASPGKKEVELPGVVAT